MATEEYPADHVEHIEVLPGYSPFWPLAIALGGLLLWIGYGTYVPMANGVALHKAIREAQPTLADAEKSRARLLSLARDLSATAEKDPAAAQIAREFGVPPHTSGASPAGDTPATSGH